MTTMESTHTVRATVGDHLRIVATLAGKDIVDALRNKATMTILIIVVLMVFFYRMFPSLTQDEPRVFVYAESPSALVTALERSPALETYAVESQDLLFRLLREGETPELALVIPASAETSSGPIVIDGYVMHWLSETQRRELVELAAAELSNELDRPVTIQIEGHDMYRLADEGVLEFSASVALLFVTTMIGVSLIPNLMLEEKQSNTLDALMVAPISAADLVAGKALAGLFYGVLTCGVVLLVFSYVIVQWPLAILAAVVGILFMTAIGLLLGSVINSRAQLQLVAWLVILPLMVPPILVLLEGLIPSGVLGVLRWVPTVAVAAIYRLSFTVDAAVRHYGVDLAVAIALTLALYAAVVWQVRRQDRR